jgi:hypothetical protein
LCPAGEKPPPLVRRLIGDAATCHSGQEIGLRGRESFLAAGGKDFVLIPCLNEHPLWLEALEKMVGRFMAPSQGQAGEKAFPFIAESRRTPDQLWALSWLRTAIIWGGRSSW